MELRHLRYFCAVAELGSFSKAARTLYVSQSAISEQVADLEREIGVTLFHRDGRSTVLTAAGEVFLAETRTVLGAAQHAVEDQVVAILPNDHRLAPGPVNVRDLAGEPFVLSSRETSPAVFDKVIELCSEAGFSPKIASISTVWSSVVLMVQAGEGISMLPLNHQQSRASDLAFCPLTAKNAYVDLIIAWSPKRDSAIMQSFRTLIEPMRRPT